MSDYRRYFVPGGTYFFTIVTQFRRRLFANELNVQRLRYSLAQIRREMPFEVNCAVVLPDHVHFIWSLPPGDDNYSKRIGLMKVKFTRSLREAGDGMSLRQPASASRQKHHDSDIWQRRFWEHTIDDEEEFEAYFDYVHYNPVRHGHVACPHLWKVSSFHRWVERGVYDLHWACQCDGRVARRFDFRAIEDKTGEP
jgi:putative transposase